MLQLDFIILTCINGKKDYNPPFMGQKVVINTIIDIQKVSTGNTPIPSELDIRIKRISKVLINNLKQFGRKT